MIQVNVILLEEILVDILEYIFNAVFKIFVDKVAERVVRRSSIVLKDAYPLSLKANKTVLSRLTGLYPNRPVLFTLPLRYF